MINLRWIVLLAVFCASVSYAGEIVLQSGDSLQGEIESISVDKLIWQSPVLGKLTIPKDSIVKITSAIPLKMRAREGACYWVDLVAGEVTLDCDEDGEITVPLVSIKETVRYKGFRKTMHHYKGSLVATGNRDSGRRQKQDWNIDVNVFLRHTDFRHNLWLKSRAESESEKELKFRFELTYQFDWFFSPKTFLSAKTAALRDELRFIDSRYSVSTGLGYQFWENRRSKLSIETGPQYLEETTFENDNEQLTTTEAYGTWRFASDFSIKLPRNMRLYTKLEHLRSVEVNDDWEVDTSSGLSVPIVSGITADVSFKYNYDNTPPEGVSARDSRLKFGLGYRW